MTSPPNTGWNSARSNFTNFAQVNSSLPNTSTTATTSTTFIVGETNQGEMQVILDRSPRTRDEYYSTHYSPQTGIRIATTLGSFFLFVLLTLLYKSKCKKHSSRCATPLLPGPLVPSPLPPLTTSSATDFIHHQVHPYNNHTNHQHQYHSPSYCPPPIHPLPHPALLLTSANSDSSDEELSTKPLCGSSSRFLQSGHMLRKQSIDIHVILPTPTISPSSSEHFRAEKPHSSHQTYYLDDRRRSSASSSIGTTTSSMHMHPPFCFPDNLKYVDDTSSENIPEVRDSGDRDEEEDQGSLGSDSVFAYCEPPPPPLPPKRRPSASPSSYYSGLEEEWRVTLTQAKAQVHHRDSFASDLESVNDYLEGGDGSGCNSRRRSSSTQTTLSDLQHCLGLANTNITSGGGGGGVVGIQQIRTPSPRLSHHPHHFMSLRQSPVQFLMAPTSGGGNSPRVKGGRKRSVDALLLGRREQQQQGNRFLTTVTPSTDKKLQPHCGFVMDPDN